MRGFVVTDHNERASPSSSKQNGMNCGSENNSTVNGRKRKRSGCNVEKSIKASKSHENDTIDKDNEKQFDVFKVPYSTVGKKHDAGKDKTTKMSNNTINSELVTPQNNSKATNAHSSERGNAFNLAEIDKLLSNDWKEKKFNEKLWSKKFLM